jgi:hypothetical protein
MIDALLEYPESESPSPPGSIVSPYFLSASDGVLDLALDFVALAVGNQLVVAERLAGRFLYGALGLLGRAGYTIFVHVAELHRSEERCLNSDVVSNN